MRSGASAIGLCLALVPGVALAYGESDPEGRPSADERRLHLLTNQVRAEPHAFPGWNASLAGPEARPPVALHPELFAAARFHANDMAASGQFAHESSDGTPAGQRIARFFSGPAGENIAKGYPDTTAVMVGWMNSTTGHRENILNPMWNALGTGRAAQNHWVQNFGRAPGLDMPAIVAGAAFSEASGLRLAAHAYDPSGRAPVRFEARLDEQAVALAPAFGAPGHQTFDARVGAPTGCAELVFFLEDASGLTHRYPSTGVLLAGPGCSASFRAGPASQDPRRPVIDADPGDAGGCRCAGRVRAPSPVLGPLASVGLVGLGGVLLLGAARRRRRGGGGLQDPSQSPS